MTAATHEATATPFSLGCARSAARQMNHVPTNSVRAYREMSLVFLIRWLIIAAAMAPKSSAARNEAMTPDVAAFESCRAAQTTAGLKNKVFEIPMHAYPA